MNQKRFISGATCPNCGASDALFMYAHDERDHVQCTDCDYSQHRPEPVPLVGSDQHAGTTLASPPDGVFWRQAVNPGDDTKS